MANLAELNDVTLKYGRLTALNHVSFALAEGEAVAVLGPNGAGKTSAMKLLTGLARTKIGNVSLFGKNPQSPRTRRHIGVTPQEAAYPHSLKVGEIIRFARSHYPAPIDAAELVAAFGLENDLNRMAMDLSGGQQRKLAVALAFCGNPKAVFLDEPTTGIDADSRQAVWHYIDGYKRAGGAIFLTTHYLEEAEFIADRIVLINQGEIIRSGTVEAVKSVVNVRSIKFRSEVAPALSNARLSHSKGHVHLYLSSDADQTVRELVTSGVDFKDLEVLPASLQDAVTELLRGSA
jgi:ABC-2 type transport system ATP-binding protein